MTERRELYDELKDKNHTARSNRMRPGGKKKYMLPSDRLSASELKKMNGAITVYTMKEPISWEKFKSYPKDIQKDYLQWFADEFTATQSMMSKIFERSPAYLGTQLKKMGHAGVLRKMATTAGLAAFNEWLRGFGTQGSDVEPVVEKTEPKAAKLEQPMFFNTITGCEMSMEGKASEIGQMLFNLFRDQKIAVNISFVGAKEEPEVACE